MAVQIRPTERSPGGGLLLVGLALLALLVGATLVRFHHLREGLAVLLLELPVVGLLVWRQSLPSRAVWALEDALRKPVYLRWWRIRWHRGCWLLAFRFPIGSSTSWLEERREAFEQTLHCSVEWWYDRKLVWMRCGTWRLPQTLDYQDFYRRFRAPEGELVVGLGLGRDGPIWLDFDEVQGLLCGGYRGAGKSVALRTLLTRLVSEYSSTELRLVLLDLKSGGVELNTFAGLPHLLAPLGKDLAESLSVLEQVREEMERRGELFAQLGVEGIREYNARVSLEQRLPRVLVVVDEFAELSAELRAPRSEARKLCEQASDLVGALARLGRNAGIFPVVCTQRPDKDVVPGQIKINLPATAAFAVRDRVNSAILLSGSPAAASLPPIPGRGIWQYGRREIAFQGLWLSKPDAARLVAALPRAARPADPEPDPDVIPLPESA